MSAKKGAMRRYIENDTVAIGQFLKDMTELRVPPFQRNYAWTDDEVRQLWLDVMEALDAGHTEYFLGPMVLKDGPDGLGVIDGQQRIATVYVILSVIRRVLRERGDNKRADWIDNQYFGEEDVDTLQRKAKFHLNEDNDPFFQRYVGADVGQAAIKREMKGRLKKDPNFLLLQAVLTIWDLVVERQKQLSDGEFHLPTLLRIEKFLRQNVYVLVLTVADEADAYMIFETLNDRGHRLTTMDLLKNHIFGRAGEHLSQVKSLWVTIRDDLSEIDPRERFLYHYWTSRHGRTSKPNLFRLMRQEITSPASAVSFTEALCKASRIYTALSNSGHPFWNDYDRRTRDNLDVLALLDAQQALPILMAAAETFQEREFSKLTEVMLVMAVRYNLIGELRTGVLANTYVEIPPKIRSGKITRSAQVFRQIRSIYPPDEAFKEAFSTKVLTDSRKARYLLSRLEDVECRDASLEHVLPRKPSQDWASSVESIGSDELSDYIDRLGNLALVSTTANRRAGGKSFEAKKDLVFSREQQIQSTRMISDYQTWLRADIEDRQRKLAERAVTVWRIEVD